MHGKTADQTVQNQESLQLKMHFMNPLGIIKGRQKEEDKFQFSLTGRNQRKEWQGSSI